MHTHTKRSSRATFPDEPGEDVCPLDFPSPFTPRPCMLLGLAQTLHSQIKSFTWTNPMSRSINLLCHTVFDWISLAIAFRISKLPKRCRECTTWSYYVHAANVYRANVNQTKYRRNVWRPVPRPTDDRMPRPTQYAYHMNCLWNTAMNCTEHQQSGQWLWITHFNTHKQ